MTTTDTPRTDACPHCGAKQSPHITTVDEYECETLISKGGGNTKRSELCRERERHAASKAEVAELNRLMIGWRQRATMSETSLEASKAEVEHIKSLLKDIPAVHANTLRGNIATLSWDSYEHILGPHPCRERAERLRELMSRLRESVSANWDEGIAGYFVDEMNKTYNEIHPQHK